MNSSPTNIFKSAAVVLATAVSGGLFLAPQADATATACGAGQFCHDYSVDGDENFTEVRLRGEYKGNAAAALEEAILCDEKSDQTAATATITIAERRISDGAVTYRHYPNQELIWGPQAGCKSFNPPDYSPTPGEYLWATRVDYSYNKPFGLGVSARAQTYHTGWVYNGWLVDWCPTC